MGCTTHHNACDCREAAIAELIKAKDREIRALKFEIGILRADVEQLRASQEGEGK